MNDISDGVMVEARIDEILTQYRESPKLLHMIRTYLRQVEILAQEAVQLPAKFNLETAVGEQLTFIGRRMGWGRCHCVCKSQPVFGFQCEGYPSPYSIVGFCDDNGTWIDCANGGISEICLSDDELYRKFLKVRAFQLDRRTDLAALQEAVKIFWGDDAVVLHAENRRITIAPGRHLTNNERQVLQLYPRVLPVPLGSMVRFHFDPNTKVFGFGEGWGGFCEEPYQYILVNDLGEAFENEQGQIMLAEAVYVDAPWMCPEDVHPYDCV